LTQGNEIYYNRGAKTNEFPTRLTNARIYGCLCSAEKLRPVSLIEAVT